MRLILLIIAIIIIMILLIVIYKQCYKLKGSAATTTMKVQNTDNNDFIITDVFNGDGLETLNDAEVGNNIKTYFMDSKHKPIYATGQTPDPYFKDIIRKVCVSLFKECKNEDFCVTLDESFQQIFKGNDIITDNICFSSYQLYKKIEPQKTIISCEWNENLLKHMNKCLMTDLVNIFSVLLTGDSQVTLIVSLDKNGKLIPTKGNNKPIQIIYNGGCKCKNYYSQNNVGSDYYSYNYSYMNKEVINMINDQDFNIEALSLKLFEQIIANSNNNNNTFSHEEIISDGSNKVNRKLFVNCRQLGKISSDSKTLENLITNCFKHKIDMWNQIANNNYKSEVIKDGDIKSFIVNASGKSAPGYRTIIIKENNNKNKIISDTKDGSKYCTYLHINQDGTSKYTFRLDLKSSSYITQNKAQNAIEYIQNKRVWGPVQNPDLLMTLNGGDEDDEGDETSVMKTFNKLVDYVTITDNAKDAYYQNNITAGKNLILQNLIENIRLSKNLDELHDNINIIKDICDKIIEVNNDNLVGLYIDILNILYNLMDKVMDSVVVQTYIYIYLRCGKNIWIDDKSMSILSGWCSNENNHNQIQNNKFLIAFYCTINNIINNFSSCLTNIDSDNSYEKFIPDMVYKYIVFKKINDVIIFKLLCESQYFSYRQELLNICMDDSVKEYILQHIFKFDVIDNTLYNATTLNKYPSFWLCCLKYITQHGLSNDDIYNNVAKIICLENSNEYKNLLIYNTNVLKKFIERLNDNILLTLLGIMNKITIQNINTIDFIYEILKVKKPNNLQQILLPQLQQILLQQSQQQYNINMLIALSKYTLKYSNNPNDIMYVNNMLLGSNIDNKFDIVFGNAVEYLPFNTNVEIRINVSTALIKQYFEIVKSFDNAMKIVYLQKIFQLYLYNFNDSLNNINEFYNSLGDYKQLFINTWNTYYDIVSLDKLVILAQNGNVNDDIRNHCQRLLILNDAEHLLINFTPLLNALNINDDMVQQALNYELENLMTNEDKQNNNRWLYEFCKIINTGNNYNWLLNSMLQRSKLIFNYNILQEIF